MAYLLGGVLFLGDAASTPWPRGGRLVPARRGVTDDPARARRSLARLRTAMAGLPVRTLCTAHARCVAATASAWASLAPSPPPG
jgi:hypothetical protein